MKCEKCGHEQATGKFCGKCGGALVAHNTDGGTAQGTSYTSQPAASVQAPVAASVYETPADPNLHVEKVKETSKQYWGYFLEHIKRPSAIFTDHNKNFVNALITFGIFALIIALGINDLISYFIAPVDDLSNLFVQESLKPSFIQILIYSVISLAVVFALSLGALYAVAKFAGPQTPFKTLATMFGTYLLPASMVLFAAYLLLLIDSRGIGTSLFLMGILFSVFVMPLFIITSLVAQKSRQIDSFYAFIAYIALFTVGLSIVLSVLVDSTLNDFLSQLYELFEYSSF